MPAGSSPHARRAGGRRRECDRGSGDARLPARRGRVGRDVGGARPVASLLHDDAERTRKAWFMKIQWVITDDDVRRVQTFVRAHGDSPLVKRRIDKNLRHEKPPITRVLFWHCLVGCLLTTQQRVGPGSAVNRFLLAKPFPLDYSTCATHEVVAEVATSVLSNFGGIRRSVIIGKELAANLAFLQTGGWEPTSQILDEVRTQSTPETERRAARFIGEQFRGFGPKQSRNLLQGVGISRYEIPIDSRITKWLNVFGFPVKLSAGSLQDRSYYELVSDGFQRLCNASDVMPCVLDAIIFASFDNGTWTKDNMVW